ncbi:MAG: alpha/beta hydrolase [Lachnospiraceae bacterium]|nr:alpha/beta hydrolase [Lachnospiraceae bacterium]
MEFGCVGVLDGMDRVRKVGMLFLVFGGMLFLLVGGCGRVESKAGLDVEQQDMEEKGTEIQRVEKENMEKQEMPGMMNGEYDIDVNGVTLHYQVEGEGKPILLGHPNSSDHTVFSEMIPKLVEAGYQVYAPDSRGQGKSSEVSEYHYDDMAEDIYCFMNELGLEKPAYYGWSDGGIIGLLLELNHPEAFSIMAISGANLNPEGINREDETIQWIEDEVEKGHDPLLELLFREPDIDPESLHAIEIPVLVTAGSNDLVRTEHTRLIADSLPNSKLMIMEGYDHSDYIRNTDFNEKNDKTIMTETLISFLNENNY